MPRHTDPLSKRSQNKRFTPQEVLDAVQLAASKRARIVRKNEEFSLPTLGQKLAPPKYSPQAYSWSVEDIAVARDAQMTGKFDLAARLAVSMRTDDALSVARRIRLDPSEALSVRIVPGQGPKAQAIAREAEALFGQDAIAVSQPALADIKACFVDHGVSFASLTWSLREDASRYDVTMTPWPIEYVWWDSSCEKYKTRTELGVEDIEHGNGRWVVFAKSAYLPFREDAAILPASMVWARHAFAMRDWAKGSATHGNAKVIGQLAEGIQLSDEEGSMTSDAESFLALLTAIASHEAPVGIKPAGSSVDYLTNSSRAWEVWAKMAENAEKAAARIYLGTDGILGAQGGAPGIDVTALFGVATTKVQGDLRCLCRCMQSGVIDIWTAINFGTSEASPRREYIFPDPDAGKAAEDFSARNQAFFADLEKYRSNGFDVTQDLVDAIAKTYDVPSPALAATSTIEAIK